MPRESSYSSELITPIIFDVKTAVYETEVVREPNMRNVAFGEKRGVTGLAPKVKLEVHSRGISFVVFRGFCHIEAGNKIRAYIHKYSKKGELHYVERDFLQIEEVSKIEKLAKNGRVMATFEGCPKNIFYC